MNSDTGFSARNLVSAAIYPRQPNTPPEKMKELNSAARDAVSSLPGVESVSISRDALLGSDDIEAQVPGSDNKISVRRAIVDGNYFSTLGLRILSGRVFDSGDREGAREVVVINHKLAETFWQGQDAVSRLLAAGDRDPYRRAGRHRPDRYDRPLRRLYPGHLQRAPSVYLHR